MKTKREGFFFLLLFEFGSRIETRMLKTKFFHILNDELIERERERKKFSHQNEKKYLFLAR